MTPLSKVQKRDISIAAAQAYAGWPDREPFEAINPELSRTACFEAWRHQEQAKACGIASLRACTQAHYGRLIAHFKALGGDIAGADRARVRDQDNGRRIARYKLDQELRTRGLESGYAAAICRSKYKCALAGASEGQLWKLLYDVRSSKHKRIPRLAAGNPF